MGKKIKIFVSEHDDFFVADNALLYPIQVGTALAGTKISNVLHDDDGENISCKNKMYCELTAQYWAWKNMPSLDYYGFFHYRRYLSFNPVQLDHYENITYFDYCDDEAVKRLMLDEKTMRALIEEYDVIYPQKNPVGGDTIYEHWCKHLEKKDIDILLQIIMERHPDFYAITRDVINSKEAIHCNMFIMKKEYFDAYSLWLFDILEECERRIDFSGYSTEKLRTIGHMAERLCAIYGNYLEGQGAKICYVQRCLFRHNEKPSRISVKNKDNFIPIVLSCNNRYVKYMSVLIESIIQNSTDENRYDIYIMHRDITKENMQIISEQVKRSPFDNFKAEFIDVNRRMYNYSNLFVDRHLSIETYYRFLVPDIFENLDKILYLDCDVVVVEDVARLFSMDVSGASIGAARDADIISLYAKDCVQDTEVRDNIDIQLGLKDAEDYFQAGVLLMNLREIRRKYSSQDFFDVACRREWKFQDQDVLNYMFKGDVAYLPLRWNTCYECFGRKERIVKFTDRELAAEYIRAKEDPAIIHYAGTPKPWESMEADMGHFFWNYAKISPMYENIIHEMNAKNFKDIMADGAVAGSRYVDANEYEVALAQRDDLQWRLDETRKSFSYKLAMAITYLPRKIKNGSRGN